MANAQYIDFLFCDNETGEEFLVELRNNGQPFSELVKEAKRIADENFDDASFEHVIDSEYAEMLGLDTY